MNHDHFYKDLANTINQTIGRKAVSVDRIKKVIKETKYIRRAQGVMRLYAFASEIPYRFFSQSEIEKLQKSPRWYEFSNKMIDLMVVEGVITPFEARMLKRKL